jgi:hypothetical protein
MDQGENEMKKTIIALSVLSALVGCSSTKLSSNEPIPSPTPAVTKDQTVAAAGKIEAPMTIDVPSWYIKAPASTDEYMFITGTAVSSDLSMSRAKAMLDAQYQLADKLNGAIDAVMRQTKKDSSGAVTNDYTSKVIKKTIIETSITGHHLEDSRVQAENRGYRTFVLVRYPVGDANRLLKDKRQQEVQKRDDDEEIEKEISNLKPKKVSQTVPIAQPVVSVVTPVAETQPVVVTKLQPQDLNLMQVDNEEYKRRRDEALMKPGAVIGRTTLR